MTKPQHSRFGRRGEQAIQANQEAALAQTNAMLRTDADCALADVARLVRADVRELFDEHGHVRSVQALPEHLAGAIASLKFVRRKTHIIQIMQFWDRPKVLELLLKHFGATGKTLAPQRRCGIRGAARGRPDTCGQAG